MRDHDTPGTRGNAADRGATEHHGRVEAVHHPSCPARGDAESVCICPAAICGDCGASGGWHALSCRFWDDHCRKCAGELVDVTLHRCEPMNTARPLDVAPCTADPALFDRTDYDAHLEAREMCGRCAAGPACRSLAGPSSSGTFGGHLYVNGRQITRDTAGGVNGAATPPKDTHDGRMSGAGGVPAPPAEQLEEGQK